MHLKRLLFLGVVIGTFFTLAFASVQAQSPITDTLLTEFEQLIQDEMAYYKIPGVAVAVISGDEVVYAQGFGSRDLENDLPFTTQTQFRIGSTTKSMTSLFIAQLVDEGILSWDTPVTDIFPEFQTANPDLTAQITVRDLLGMNTGLVTSPINAFDWATWDVNDMLGVIAQMEIGGDFREFYSYNNEVYALGGYAGVVATGVEPTLEHYKALIQERIFDPIGMDSAIITDDVSLLGADYAESYELSLLDGELARMDNPPIHVVAPAGAVWTTIEDMASYVITQMNGGVTSDGVRIVSEENLAETWKPSVSIGGDENGIENTAYGMGWVTQTYQGIPIRYHDGGWAGYSTQMVILPEDDIALIIFTNGSHGALFGGMLNYAFTELVHNLEPTAVTRAHEMWDDTLAQYAQAEGLLSTDVGDVSAFVGNYEDNWVVEQREDDSFWVSRGEWHFRLAYIAMLSQYIVINNSGAGTIVEFETEGDVVKMTLQLGEGNSLGFAKIN
ncbi:MAG: serine hydrolase domain-containing protein [bacterium]|nr:serine hydrolase domain-containing protein [bacterium]